MDPVVKIYGGRLSGLIAPPRGPQSSFDLPSKPLRKDMSRFSATSLMWGGGAGPKDEQTRAVRITYVRYIYFDIYKKGNEAYRFSERTRLSRQRRGRPAAYLLTPIWVGGAKLG